MCITPIKVKNSGDQPVPCGKCTECRSRRASAWSFRLTQQEKVSQSAHFVTLTYDNTHVPLSAHGFMTLEKRDVQLFFKRLRKASPLCKIKYYVAGEYGGKTKRPHYHALIFNADVKNIDASWMLGVVHYGTVSGASVGYTLKYMSKQSQIPVHKNDDRKKEFALMSKGLGANYLTVAIQEWHKADMENRMYVNVGDGKKAAMPRYYKDKLYSEEERKKIADGAAARQCAVELRRFDATDGHPGALRPAIIEREKARIVQPYKDNL